MTTILIDYFGSPAKVRTAPHIGYVCINNIELDIQELLTAIANVVLEDDTKHFTSILQCPKPLSSSSSPSTSSTPPLSPA